jgi:two-component system chemotaxis sensor kinase CheA
MTGDDVRSHLLATYAGEHRDHLAVLRDLLAGDEAPADIEEAYRRAHSLKGAARAVDLPAVEALAHDLESRLEALWSRDVPWSPSVRRHLLNALDAIEDGSAAALSGAESTPLVRVEAEVMDRLLAGSAALLEEAARQDRLAQRVRRPAEVARPEFAMEVEDASWRLGRLAADIAAEVSHLRLVAADAAFAGLGPLVRETAAACGRSVSMEEVGLETRSDREVLQALREPVLHALRNAVRHGIEAPEGRVAQGKPPEGRVRLAVTASAGWLRVVVEDDGRGFDLEALARAAVQRGLLLPAEAATASPERLRALAFLPGLSTVDEVDRVAGRGMGMDIVRRVATRLQGGVELGRSSLGGAAVVMTVPVTLTSRSLLVVEAGGERWCLPEVRRLAWVPRADLTEAEGRLMVAMDGVETPLVLLSALLGGAEMPASDPMPVAVVAGVGLVVERFCEVVRLPVVSLDPPLDTHPLLSGSVVLGDGTLALVAAPTGLVVSAAAASKETMPRRGGRVLVVDDSPTAREALTALLESHGYRVVTAADGVEALEQVGKVDVVVTDVDMPRLDGFGLLRAVAGRVPVVLVTSRHSEDDRCRAAHLGAVACLAKLGLDQAELLDVLAREVR